MQASTNTYWERVHLGELEAAELLLSSQAYLTESWQNTKLTSYEKNVFTNWFTFTFSEKQECFFPNCSMLQEQLIFFSALNRSYDTTNGTLNRKVSSSWTANNWYSCTDLTLLLTVNNLNLYPLLISFKAKSISNKDIPATKV